MVEREYRERKRKKEKERERERGRERNLMLLFFSKKCNLGRSIFLKRQSWFNFLSQICKIDEGNR